MRSRICHCRYKTVNHSVESIFTAKGACHMKKYFLHPQATSIKKENEKYKKTMFKKSD